MDAQVGIIRNQTVANGTEDIVELVALLHQAVLYQQAGLGMYALARLPAVGTEKPGNQQHQCPDNQRIEQNEPDTVTLHQRYIQNDALALRTVRVHTEKLQLFVIEQQLAPKVLYSQ